MSGREHSSNPLQQDRFCNGFEERLAHIENRLDLCYSIIEKCKNKTRKNKAVVR